MNYTIKISGNSPQAKSIVKMLKALQKDYDFIDIEENSERYNILEEEDDLSQELKDELDKRWEYIKNHPDELNTWEDVKNSLLSHDK